MGDKINDIEDRSSKGCSAKRAQGFWVVQQCHLQTQRHLEQGQVWGGGEEDHLGFEKLSLRYIGMILMCMSYKMRHELR